MRKFNSISKAVAIALLVGGTSLQAQVTKVNTTFEPQPWSNIPVVDSKYVKGGMMSLGDLDGTQATFNATINGVLPAERRTENMMIAFTDIQLGAGSYFRRYFILADDGGTPLSTADDVWQEVYMPTVWEADYYYQAGQPVYYGDNLYYKKASGKSDASAFDPTLWWKVAGADGDLSVNNIDADGNVDITGSLSFDAGNAVSEISTDGTLTDNSDAALVTEKAVKTYVDNQLSNGKIVDGTAESQVLRWDNTNGKWIPEGDLTIDASGNLVTTGNITAQDIDVNGNLNVDGTTTLNDAVNITSGGLDIDAGGLNIDAGGATITGAVDLNTSLNVDGATTITAGGLDVTGGVTVQAGSNLTVDDNATIGGTLNVTGASTMSTLSTTGAATLNSASVTNNASVGGTLGITGAVNAASSVTVGNALTVSSGGADITGDVDVTGAVISSGLITANGGLTVEDGDNFTLDGQALTDVVTSTEVLSGTGDDATIATTKAIVNYVATQLSSGKIVDGTVEGQTLRWDDAQQKWVSNSALINDGTDITMSGNLGVVDVNASGNAAITGTLGVTGATTMTTLSTSGAATLNSASVTNNASVGGTLTVTGASTLNGNVDATAGLDVTGANLTVGGGNFGVDVSNGNVSTAGTISATGAISSSSTVTAGTGLIATTGGLNVQTGGANIDGVLAVDGDEDNTDDLTVDASGNVIMTNDVAVGGDFQLSDNDQVNGIITSDDITGELADNDANLITEGAVKEYVEAKITGSTGPAAYYGAFATGNEPTWNGVDYTSLGATSVATKAALFSASTTADNGNYLWVAIPTNWGEQTFYLNYSGNKFPIMDGLKKKVYSDTNGTEYQIWVFQFAIPANAINPGSGDVTLVFSAN